MKCNVSIVIITKNRKDEIKKCINSLRGQKFDGKKEIVVVDSSYKATPIPKVKYIYKKDFGIAAARNVGIKSSKYNLVAFFDDDCIASKNCLQELVDSLGKNAGVGGAVLPTKTNLIGKAMSYIGYPGGGLRWYYKAKGKIIKVKHISTCNCLYKKTILKKLNFFDEKFKYGGEDSDLSRRIIRKKFSLVYTPKAIVYHKPRESIVSIFKWFFRRGVADIYSKSMIEKIKTLFSFHSSLLKILFCAFIIYFLKLFGLFFLFFSIFVLFIKKLAEDKVPLKEKQILFLIPIVLLVIVFARGIGNIYGMALKD